MMDELKKKYSFLNFVELSPVEKELVWKWRNADEVRKWMYSTDLISYENHLDFLNSLKDHAKKIYFLVKRDSLPIGVFSIVDIQTDHGEWGYYIAPEYHGQSLGVEFYYYILKFVFEDLNFSEIRGYARVDNKAANSLNDLFGFTKVKEDKIEHGVLQTYFLRSLTRRIWKEITRVSPRVIRFLKLTVNKNL